MIDGLSRGKPAFLASVTNVSEAEIALRGGADIIDCKDPAKGALGSLDTALVRKIVDCVRGRVPVSATVGDLPADAEILLKAVDGMASTGVDIVKIGFFGDQDPRPAISYLGNAFRGTRLVAVLMADQEPDFSLLPGLASSGFAGVMLDTGNKSVGRLTNALPLDVLDGFVHSARANSLYVGLAGSLTQNDIPALANLEPDMLGFRGALCSAGRTSAIDGDRVAAVRRSLDSAKHAEAWEPSIA
jgi:(5-formylfuran-3-yl)methyl phosphate synthase